MGSKKSEKYLYYQNYKKLYKPQQSLLDVNKIGLCPTLPHSKSSNDHKKSLLNTFSSISLLLNNTQILFSIE